MQSLHRAFRAGLRRETLVFLEISQDPPDRRFGGWEAHVPQNDHDLAGLQVRCRGAERMSRIACFSSWDHAGWRSRRGRREFGPNRPSSWSFCPWNGARRETPTILAAASADTSRRRVSHHGFSAHRRASLSRRRFHFSGDTSREPGPDLRDAGGGTGRDRWYGFVGGSLLYRFRYPQNENFHAARQGQSVPAPALKRTGKAHQEC